MRKAISFPRFVSTTFAFALVFFVIAVPPQQAEDSVPTPVSKPLLALIFDKNCKTWCSQVRPMVADLQKTYGEEVEFAELDVTPESLQDAKKKAKELGIGSLLGDARSFVPLVLICSANRKKFEEFVGPKSKDVYEAFLKKLLSKRG